MRSLLLSVTLLGLTGMPVLAQTTPPAIDQNAGARPGNEIGTGNSLPLSDRASNITDADTRSVIAPRLPSPDVSDDAAPKKFLMAARQALAAGRTGEAQEALERAETRLLSRSVSPSKVREASNNQAIADIGSARRALAAGQRSEAVQSIEAAVSQLGS